jgi:hypothetical protein
MVERCDVVVAVGGRWWLENPIGAGIPIEFELAQSRGLPCFLLGVFGGAAAGYLKDNPEILRNLRNGLDKDHNEALATAPDAADVALRVVGQLGRLPLVRGKPGGGRNFRILALDGGGIKGTFTAAALADGRA